jgi:hypothetical protein
LATIWAMVSWLSWGCSATRSRISALSSDMDGQLLDSVGGVPSPHWAWNSVLGVRCVCVPCVRLL